jgi:hypothetical protein
MEGTDQMGAEILFLTSIPPRECVERYLFSGFDKALQNKIQ